MKRFTDKRRFIIEYPDDMPLDDVCAYFVSVTCHPEFNQNAPYLVTESLDEQYMIAYFTRSENTRVLKIMRKEKPNG